MDRTSSTQWRKNGEGWTGFNIQKLYRYKCRTQYGLNIKKPTPNEWVSNLGGCSTAAEEEGAHVLVEGGGHRDGWMEV